MKGSAESKAPLLKADRIAVGIWAQWPQGARWSNEGMTRLLGFLIEGIAETEEYMFRIVLPDSIRAAAENDLATLNAKVGRDYTVHSPSDANIVATDLESLAHFANEHVHVAAWLSIFPTFTFAKYLRAPVTTIFPDAIPVVFHEFSDAAWGESGGHVIWRDCVSEMLKTARRVITFSDHVAERQAQDIFNVPASAIRIVPHAAPDLHDLLPFVSDRRKTVESLSQAAQMLRMYARERGLTYLYDFPFEEVPYIAVSTQDRVTKNIRAIALALDHIIRVERISMKVITTAPLHFGADWTPLPRILEDSQIHYDFLSAPDLPRDIHAAFYHCATVAVHTSIFEGGHTPFPFCEAISVGTPCLMARGPHTEEVCGKFPDLSAFVFDPNDQEGLVNLLIGVLRDPVPSIRSQSEIYYAMSKHRWKDVAIGYARAATE